jgi:hypothetical protein
MGRRRFRLLVGAVLVGCLLVSYSQFATGAERKKPNWLASCPEVIDATPNIETKKTKFLRFLNTGQEFTLLATNSVEPVTEPQSVIGCYVDEDSVSQSDLH